MLDGLDSNGAFLARLLLLGKRGRHRINGLWPARRPRPLDDILMLVAGEFKQIGQVLERETPRCVITA
jgi:hypothetical protein